MFDVAATRTARAGYRVATFVAIAWLLHGCRGADAVALVEPVNPAGPPPAVSAAPMVGRFATLVVTTEASAPIVSRDDYLSGSYRMISADSTPLAQGTLEIKGRGNSTWNMPKKPYRLKLATSTGVLGMPANRHWVLLANYADKTLMRNSVTFELSRQFGMTYTPRAEYVHLELNGAYEGLYQLAEHVRIAPERVNIQEVKLADSTEALITGGYLLEIDQTYGEDFCFTGHRTTSMVFCVQSPETLNDARWAKHRAYLTGYIRQLEDALFGPQFADPTVGYAAYLDVASVVDYFLINEIVRNVDGNLRRSTFLYKPRGGKMALGPVWDFDIAIGNVNFGNADLTEGWHVRTAPWYARLFEDPAFAARVTSRWRQMQREGTIPLLQQYVNRHATYLSEAQQTNFQRWPILDTWVRPNRVVAGSYDGEVLAMTSWLAARVEWMNGEFAR